MSVIEGKLLEGIPLFAGIEHAELAGFLRIFQSVAFDAGVYLVRQGQRSAEELQRALGTTECRAA